jgi:ribose-phosphate pyrophosphokinase
MGAGLAVVDKRRDSPESTAVMNIRGEVKGKTCLLVDDLIATGGSLVEAAAALKREGATEVYACVTHPILSGSAREHILRSPLKELIVTNTVPIPPASRHSKITALSVASLLGEAIQRIHYEQSISSLFDGVPG